MKQSRYRREISVAFSLKRFDLGLIGFNGFNHFRKCRFSRISLRNADDPEYCQDSHHNERCLDNPVHI